MPDRKIRDRAAAVVTILSATMFIAVGATSASAAPTAPPTAVAMGVNGSNIKAAYDNSHAELYLVPPGGNGCSFRSYCAYRHH